MGKNEMEKSDRETSGYGRVLADILVRAVPPVESVGIG